MDQERAAKGEAVFYDKKGKQQQVFADTTKDKDKFQSEFDTEAKDSTGRAISEVQPTIPTKESALKNAKIFDYRRRFASEYIVSGFNNSVLVNRFQPYAGGSGPIYLSNADILNGIIRLGTSELMEDLKFTGGFRIATNLQDIDYLVQFQNLRRRLDWGLTYYRSTLNDFPIFNPDVEPIKSSLSNKLYSNLYQLNLSWPLDDVRSLRATLGYRNDRVAINNKHNHHTALQLS